MPTPTLFAPDGSPLLHAATPNETHRQVQIGNLQFFQEHAPDGTARLRISPVHPQHVAFGLEFLGTINEHNQVTVRLSDDYGTHLVYNIIGLSREYGTLVGELQDTRAGLRVVGAEGAVEGAQLDFDAS
jgi:hypothetical protein